MIPEFTVVIPTRHRPALLLKCLDALGRQRLARDQFEVIVVDDGNSSDTATAVALFTRQVAQSGGTLEVRYLAQPQPQGFAAARNRGWKAARGRTIAFTDDDCLPQPDWLLAALPNFRRGAQVATGPVRLIRPGLARPGSTMQHAPRALYLETGEFTSANGFCRQSALARVGGFEEAFDSAWREDYDLQFKFIQSGIPISQCPEAVVVHAGCEMSWHAALTNERNSQYDALLYKRHPDLFRQRIETDRGLILEYYASVLAVAIGLLGVLSGNSTAAMIGFGGWGVLLANLIRQRLSGNPASARWPQTVLTALVLPFLAVYWRLYGALKYKVLYW